VADVPGLSKDDIKVQVGAWVRGQAGSQAAGSVKTLTAATASSTSACLACMPAPLCADPSTNIPAPPPLAPRPPACHLQVSPDRVLTISGERKSEHQEGSEAEGNLRVERSYGSFMRRFRLPENVDVEGARGGVGWGGVKGGRVPAS
jgi:hypothetical protein